MSEDVQLSHVCVDFGAFRAVDDVDLTIRAGEFFSFLGPSGCGKTTILRMISGFIEPTSGEIKIGGQNMRGIGPNKRPTALIFQNLALFPLMTVWENIAFGLEVRGVSKDKRKARAEELLRVVDLVGSGDKRISQLSGGQKQRVAIARALAVEPKVMLLDEPLSALDLKLRQHMRSELRAIQKRTDVTFVYITHDQGEALAMSDRVAVMSAGVLQQVGTPADIYNQPANGFVASFVGENNRVPGKVVGLENGMARFHTPAGLFLARLGPGIQVGSTAKLYVRPENARLTDAVEGDNNVPLRISEVAFEGSFINIHGHDAGGHAHIVQMRNDRDASVPAVGDQRGLTFSPEHAVVLADAGARP
ncbi:ABC transporter ATP-binding protein [Lichenifustis flavocetrariae]|uniref:ABC transporter ATP-binding protein n=1 Tax=Lichenifustis flavocetrariae TaxID=2949735 RepID=A0AA41Z0I5_9HYPH|nr:ABC transporter ATP-binding protein [Lichenifustis flavocetrariae]MCW6510528.1 ABC transporter ATP-binding protein [Lichenifustis flavocetrariae]